MTLINIWIVSLVLSFATFTGSMSYYVYWPKGYKSLLHEALVYGSGALFILTVTILMTFIALETFSVLE